MCGFKSVPCQVVQMAAGEQANAFSAVNGNVTAITGFNLFRAALASGDAEAGAMTALAKEAGCAVATANASAKNKKPGTIFFLGGFRDLYRRHGATLGAALALMRRAEYWRDEAELWGGNICHPTLAALCERPDALASPKIDAVFERFDVWGEIEKLAEIRRRRLRANLLAMTGKEALRRRWLDYLDAELPGRRAEG